MRQAKEEATEVRLIKNNSKDTILKIEPMTEQAARNWLGAANTVGDAELVQHFVEQLKGLQ